MAGSRIGHRTGPNCRTESHGSVLGISPSGGLAYNGRPWVNQVRCRDSESSVDDLGTWRGVVLGRAVTTLRSVETQPLAWGFVLSVRRDPTRCAPAEREEKRREKRRRRGGGGEGKFSPLFPLARAGVARLKEEVFFARESNA